MSVVDSYCPDMDSWPPQLIFLKDLEALFKCPICFDYMQAPVILPCDHNYCSLCVRKYFIHRERCPACAVPASSNQLRTNQLLDKTIQQFKKIRQPLRALCLGNTRHQPPKAGFGTSNDVESKKKDTLCSSKPSTSTQREIHRSRTNSCKSQATKQDRPKDGTAGNRPSAHPVSDSDDSDVEIITEGSDSSFSSDKPCSVAFSLLSSNPASQADGSKPRTVQSKLFSHLLVSGGDGGRSASNRGQCSAKENVHGNQTQDSKPTPSLNSSPKAPSPLLLSQDGNFKSQSSSPKVSSPRQLSGSKSLQGMAVAGCSHSPSGSPLVEKVPCPVCGIPVLSHAVNQHLDLCLASQGKMESLRPREKKKPLPKLVYNLMSDKDIRRRLKELGLNSQGDRQAMIKRHHEFTLYYNADCDSLTPKDVGDLVKEFEDMQRLQKKLSSKPSSSGQSILRFSKNSKKEDIEKANKEYAQHHKAQFQTLIKQAKRRMASARQTCGTSTAAAAALGLTEDGSQHSMDEAPSSAAVLESDSSEHAECLVGDDDACENDDQNVVKVSELVGKFEDSAHSLLGEPDSAPSESNAASDEESATCDCVAFSSGEETGSEVFDYDSESMFSKTTAPVGGRRRRALRPSQPSWQDEDGLHVSSVSTLSDKSLTGGSPGRSCPRRSTRSNAGCLLNAGKPQSRCSSDKFQSVTSADELQSSSLENAVPQKNLPDDTKSSCSFDKLLSARHSPDIVLPDFPSSKPQAGDLPGQIENLSGNATRDSLQNSKSCQQHPERTNSDVTHNPEDLAAASEIQNRTYSISSDPDTSLTNAARSMSSDENHRHVCTEEAKLGKRTRKESAKRGKPGYDARKRERKKEERESPRCDDAGTVHDKHTEMVSSPEAGAAELGRRGSPPEPAETVLRGGDSKQAPGVPASAAAEECASESQSGSSEGDGEVRLHEESSGYFEVTLSDIEEEATSPPPEVEEEALIPGDPPPNPPDVPLVPPDVPLNPVDVPAIPVDVPLMPADVPTIPVDAPLISADAVQRQESKDAKSPKRRKCSAKEKDSEARSGVPKSDSLTCGSSENLEVTPDLLALPEEKQALEEGEEGPSAPDASQITKLKSLLRKKKRKSAVWYQKSVRFFGLRSRISDIHFEGHDSGEPEETCSDKKMDSQGAGAEPLSAAEHGDGKTTALSQLQTAESPSGGKETLTEPASRETTECVVLHETRQICKPVPTDAGALSHGQSKRGGRCSKTCQKKKKKQEKHRSFPVTSDEEEDSLVKETFTGVKPPYKVNEDPSSSSSAKEASALSADRQRDETPEFETAENKPKQKQRQPRKRKNKSDSSTIAPHVVASCTDSILSETSAESKCKKKGRGSSADTKIMHNVPELHASGSELSSVMEPQLCATTSESVGAKVSQVIPGSGADLPLPLTEVNPGMLPVKRKRGGSRKRKYVEVEESDPRDDDESDDKGKELALLPADIVKTKQRRASHAARTRSRNKQN